MSVFSSPSFDQHELVTFTHDKETGLKAIIAVHNTNLGPGVGGCRMFPYQNDTQALEDVLRLSRGMTYKSALAGLPMGGGKAVIIGDASSQKTPALLHAMGDFIQAQGGKYVTAEDSGTSVADMKLIGTRTEYVSGVDDAQQFGGDPSPFTAYGVKCGIQAALQHKFSKNDLSDIRVAVQGAGSVGRHLIDMLIKGGASVIVADINQANIDLALRLGDAVSAVSVDDIMGVEADVFAPCAMGAILNDDSIGQLKMSIVAGAANNQIAQARHAQLLQEQGILYAPDFVINAGGIIDVHHQRAGTKEQSEAHVSSIGDTLATIFKQSKEDQVTTVAVAKKLAEDIFKINAKMQNAA